MSSRRLLLTGALAGLVLGAAIAFAWSRRPYTSVAVLRVVPQQIPKSLVASGDEHVDVMLPSLIQTALSRGSLVNVMGSYGLYADEKLRRPLEDVVELMRRSIRIAAVDPQQTIQVSFSYTDPTTSQKVTTDLVGRIILEWERQWQMKAVLTRQFITDRATAAAKEWEESLTKMHAAERSGESAQRARLDADIARQQYENLRAKLSEAATLEEMQRRRQGVSLELTAPATVQAGWRPPIWLGGVGGAAAGALLALAWIRGSVRKHAM